jgi:hypothetical protein
MLRGLRTTLHPAWYHGQGARPPFFEGWYFKLIDATEEHRYAIIPGVFLGRDREGSHAFVQVLDGTTGQATYHPYPVAEFRAAEDAFDVRVGPSQFSLERISLKIETEEQTVAGDVSFRGLTPWPVKLAAPGVMGWYAWVPSMECYHGVLSLDHEIGGALHVDGRRIDFTGGRGYIEKDWGRSFPSGWVWMQTNHFEQTGTSLTGSIAMVPWLRGSFRGFIVGLWHKGVLNRFATYTRAEVEKFAVADDQVALVVRDRRHRLEMLALRSPAGVLRGPSGIDMHGRVPETLQATVEIRLSELVGRAERVVFEGIGRNAGLEVVGRID